MQPLPALRKFFASAIVANHRGDVVGERTFGLASEQKLISLDDGSALILTVANYYNPGGKSILEEGITPKSGWRHVRTIRIPAMTMRPAS